MDNKEAAAYLRTCPDMPSNALDLTMDHVKRGSFTGRLIADLLDPQPVAPEGWEFTGDIRNAGTDEYVEWNGSAVKASDFPGFPCGPHRILRKLPVAPEGYELTGEYRNVDTSNPAEYYIDSFDGATCATDPSVKPVGRHHILRPTFKNGDVVACQDGIRIIREGGTAFINGVVSCINADPREWHLASDGEIDAYIRKCYITTRDCVKAFAKKYGKDHS